MGNYGDYKALGDGVCELKFNFGPGYRIYFAEEEAGFIVILLSGGDKSSQVQDIKTAKMYWQELLERDHD